MKSRILAIGLLLLVAVLVLPRRGKGDRLEASAAGAGRGGATIGIPIDDGRTATRPARLSEREALSRDATHGPQQLRDFYLPAIELQGESLEAALERLRVEYATVCELSGEVPLALRFELPGGKPELLRVSIPAGSLDRSIRLLGAIAGLKVSRDGKCYRFERELLGGPVERRLSVPPDLLSRLEAIGVSRGLGSLRAGLVDAGIDLDPSTRVGFLPSDSTLELRTGNAADLARIEGLVASVVGEAPVQAKLDVRLVEIPDGLELPDFSQPLSDQELQGLLRQLASTEGVQLQTAPIVTARSGESASVRVVREIIAPDPVEDGRFVMHEVGKVLDVTPSALGFGHGLEFGYSDTVGDIGDQGVEIHERVKIQDDVYVGDRRSQVFVQTREDGTRTLLVLGPARVDATGRPMNPDPK